MANFSSALKGFAARAKERDSYWVEVAKLSFAVSLEARRKAAGLNYSALAQKLGTSAAYITKIFRGDSNLTLESMVKLARATDSKLEVRVVEANVSVSQWERVFRQTPVKAAQTVTAAHYLQKTYAAANAEQFSSAA